MANEGYPAGGGSSLSASAILARLIGATTLAAGALLYGAGTSTLSTLAIGASGTFLKSNGSAPAWANIAASDIASGTLAAARGGTGVSNAGTLTNASNTTITGGGTLALGGYTLTVPANGTALLLGTAQTVTGEKTFSANTAFGLAPQTAGYILSIADASGATRALIENQSNAGPGAGFYFVVRNAGTLVGSATLRVTNTGQFDMYNGGASEALALSITSAQQVQVPAATASTSTATGALVVTGGIAGGGSIYHGGHTLTSDVRAFDSAVTWNSGGTTFTAWKLNVTDTASASASRLLDLQVGGSSKASIGKSGGLTLTGGTVTAQTSMFSVTQNLNNGSQIFHVCTIDVTDTASDALSTAFRVTKATTRTAFSVLASGLTQVASTTTTDAAANSALSIRADRTGSGAAAGFGSLVTFTAEASDGVVYENGRAEVTWATATFGSRKGRMVFSATDTAARECLRLEASGSAAMIGFLGAAAIARPSSTGETGGFTAGAGTAMNSASTSTGNTGSTAYTFGDVVKHLKNLGLLTS